VSQQINLYEARLRPRHELALARNLGICTLVLLVAMTALSLWTRLEADRKTEAALVSQKQLAGEQEKLAALTGTIAQRRVSPALAAELESAKAVLEARKDVMVVLGSGKLGNTSGFSAIMSGFARQSQSDLWLTGFQVTTGGQEIEIRGRLLDPAKLPAYVQRLSSEPVFQGRRFAALEMRGVDPDDPKTDQPGVARVADAASQQAVARLPRFVEFILRSENVGHVDVATRGGVKR
jgi:hypothetical protein